MPTKILGQAGISLADQYDIEGSIAGVEQLDSDEVKTVHEMGGTLFSERLSGRIVAASTGAINQGTAFNIGFSFSEVTRILGIQVLSDDAVRVSRCQVSISSPPAFDNTDLPIWFWQVADSFRVVNILLAGSVTTLELLTSPTPPLLPNLLTGQDSPRGVFTLNMRGTSTTFGAGTVSIQMLIYAAFPQVAGLSSFGLPPPSW